MAAFGYKFVIGDFFVWKGGRVLNNSTNFWMKQLVFKAPIVVIPALDSPIQLKIKRIPRLRRLMPSSLNRRFKWKPNLINQAS
jgi:hypothetical protein